jgi:hypothetical protein
MTTAYASEVCPVALRAYLTTYVNLCWVFGQLIATGVLTSFLKRTDEWAYRSKLLLAALRRDGLTKNLSSVCLAMDVACPIVDRVSINILVSS